ncbi:RlmE family RNA methyltransferase [Candidatus Peregrinibacteria bacterium]|jgi:23S rRNA (uridine2552-2'-O)-methyltransferase|nr:RlmE family RNA methyltransferase [Candidatus Peregrinibacteria bacterium]MBT4631998.1 RlmE family RNA methyltransferase [Candidatus Peregrinibacteria bacterium]MBT5516944.1 RlmE family RNA methyltransferase [Candidatus Peregrinibacteria bacterium]MBT5823799.1 RlmE family RNA methyltransferase [Candidatus Peregrinibacteria bacterium]
MPRPYKVKDKYFILAKQQGYRARSAFKLKDIQKKFHLLKAGQTVVDLGGAPGSFLQVILEHIGKEGKALVVDLQEIEPLSADNAFAIKGDIYKTTKLLPALKKFGPVDVVTSDLAPKTSGIRDMDQSLSVDLTAQALFLATQCLKPGGHFLGKVFDGEELHALIKIAKKSFKEVKMFKPPACRDRSFETYLVAMDFNAKNLRVK